MRWYFQPDPNRVADNMNQCIATVAGNFQDELGGGEWSPSNLRTMLWQESPGSDWYALTVTIPMGEWGPHHSDDTVARGDRRPPADPHELCRRNHETAGEPLPFFHPEPLVPCLNPNPCYPGFKIPSTGPVRTCFQAYTVNNKNITPMERAISSLGSPRKNAATRAKTAGNEDSTPTARQMPPRE